MENNKLVLKDSKGIKKEYRILFDIESSVGDKNYVIYTNDIKDRSGEIKAFASSYEIGKNGNMKALKPIVKDEELDFIEKILSSLQSKE